MPSLHSTRKIHNVISRGLNATATTNETKVNPTVKVDLQPWVGVSPEHRLGVWSPELGIPPSYGGTIH